VVGESRRIRTRRVLDTQNVIFFIKRERNTQDKFPEAYLSSFVNLRRVETIFLASLRVGMTKKIFDLFRIKRRTSRNTDEPA